MTWFTKKHMYQLIVLIVFTAIGLYYTEFDIRKFKDFHNMIDFLERWIWPKWELFPKLAKESIVTLSIAFIGSFFGLLIALPLSFIAAKNTSRFKFVYQWMRIFLSFLRSIPEIVIGLVLLTVLGLGPFPAVLAIVIHNIGVLGKLISELIEASDEGPHEAMKAVGAEKSIADVFAILPQIWPNVLSHYFYRFEVAIRTSLILGFIGAGGIGQQLFNHFKTFQYKAVSMDVLLIMLLVIAVDFYGSRMREKVI
ncbi:phosphonate ABC transporter, permease protein PhnE [Lottiidibacillus patelloidae]|uniref:Phosphonate ABC transporter, permease protein PhnE n=1 Tax=Lottiidibacillus patelloidae TaxID=2670334 RepID=A0A263BRH9_9BACI|nr:phosphonate ABC transporter, permease protein PhnE [Lottiidibacillus patelloidae]OZM56313.1 phosphonate ABC transporter, permease protein PhnE [Lottiidibacillus patelloidae]